MALAQKDLLLPPPSSLLELCVEPTALQFFIFKHFIINACIVIVNNLWLHIIEEEVWRCLSIWLLPGLLPLCANSIAFCCSFYDSLILSDFSKIVFPVILILLRIGSNFFIFTDEDFGIHVFPDLTIFNMYRAFIGSSFVHLDLDDMVRWSMTGVVWRR